MGECPACGRSDPPSPDLALVRRRQAQLAELRKVVNDEDAELETAERALVRLGEQRAALEPKP